MASLRGALSESTVALIRSLRWRPKESQGPEKLNFDPFKTQTRYFQFKGGAFPTRLLSTSSMSNVYEFVRSINVSTKLYDWTHLRYDFTI